MALFQVGDAFACTEVAFFEVGAARVLHPAPPGYEKCVGHDPPPPTSTPDPVSGDAAYRGLIRSEMWPIFKM